MQDNNTLTPFGSLVIKWLDDNGIIASDIARCTGLDKSYLSKVFNGHANVTVRLINDIVAMSRLPDELLIERIGCSELPKLQTPHDLNLDDLYISAGMIPEDIVTGIVDLGSLVINDIRSLLLEANKQKLANCVRELKQTLQSEPERSQEIVTKLANSLVSCDDGSCKGICCAICNQQSTTM